MADDTEEHTFLELSPDGGTARCSCTAQAYVTSQDAARIWHALHTVWPEDEAVMLADKMASAQVFGKSTSPARDIRDLPRGFHPDRVIVDDPIPPYHQ